MSVEQRHVNVGIIERTSVIIKVKNLKNRNRVTEMGFSIISKQLTFKLIITIYKSSAEQLE